MGRGGLERGAHYNSNNNSIHGGGVFRRLMDQIMGSRWCLKRVWVVAVTVTSLITLASLSPMGDSIQAATIFYPRRRVYSYSEETGPEQFLWERRTQRMISFSVSNAILDSDGAAAAARVNDDGPKPKLLPAANYARTSRTTPSELSGTTTPATDPYIEDMVALPEEVDLFLVRDVLDDYSVRDRISACRYGEELKSSTLVVDFVADGRLAVTCKRPSALLEKKLRIANVSLELDGGEGAPLLQNVADFVEPAVWNAALVYAVQSTDEDVVLYVKAVFESRRKAGEYTELENFRCSFGEGVETNVTAAALEVYRCEHPKFGSNQIVPTRVKVHLIYKGKSIPSIAYYETASGPNLLLGSEEKIQVDSDSSYEDVVATKKHLVCSCTMVWNVAKFLKEWVLYNSDLGVEKFFLYDNNSEDGIEGAVRSLSQFNVTRTIWPWVKTQEAGFSHCAVEAQRECTWILFTDVDEYLFPKRWLQLAEPPAALGGLGGGATAARRRPVVSMASPLETLIEDTLTRVTVPANSLNASTVKVSSSSTANSSSSIITSPPLKVGQISFLCRNFGPSGRTASPPEGVTQGYTCRDLKEQRHKSLVYFPALKPHLQNVIHHYYLVPEFQTVYLDVRQAVVNHYKYQVWSEFETKFTKRASTYVVDWKENKNLGSRDRPEGVGPEAEKPVDWETRHCEKNDTALRDYTRRRFGLLEGGDSTKLHMAWELY